MRSNLGDDPDVVVIADMVGLDEFAVVGRLHRLWSWLDQHSESGTNVRISSAFVARLCGQEGFADALIAVGWLEGGDGAYTFPKFDRHNGSSAKRRDSESKRKSRSRKEGQLSAPKADICPHTMRDREEKSRDIDSLPREEPEGVAPSNPTWEQVQAIAAGQMISTDIAERWFDDMEACGWMDAKNRSIKNHHHALKAWATRYQENEAAKKSRNGSGNRVNRNTGTTNNPSEYAGR